MKDSTMLIGRGSSGSVFEFFELEKITFFLQTSTGLEKATLSLDEKMG